MGVMVIIHCSANFAENTDNTAHFTAHYIFLFTDRVTSAILDIFQCINILDYLACQPKLQLDALHPNYSATSRHAGKLKFGTDTH